MPYKTNLNTWATTDQFEKKFRKWNKEKRLLIDNCKVDLNVESLESIRLFSCNIYSTGDASKSILKLKILLRHAIASNHFSGL